MSRERSLSRRHFARAAAALLAALPRLADAQSFDQGIGGTGVVRDPNNEPKDQNIGGTGVVGTIRRFGSIYVNDLRISYPDDLPVSWSGDRRSPKALKLGQVVRVVAAPAPTGLVARSIAIQHEVVGSVQAVGPDEAIVLGQTVSLAALPGQARLAVGQYVAVSGLRQIDGTIVASLIERAPAGPVRVTGPLRRATDGSLLIGALAVRSVDPALVGERIALVGRLTGATLRVTSAVAERAALSRLDARRWSVEAYVAREGAALHLGSGLRVEGDVPAPEAEGLAILTTAFEAGEERLVVKKIAAETPSAAATRGTRDEGRETRGEDGRNGHDGAGSRGHGGGKGK